MQDRGSSWPTWGEGFDNCDDDDDDGVDDEDDAVLMVCILAKKLKLADF